MSKKITILQLRKQRIDIINRLAVEQSKRNKNINEINNLKQIEAEISNKLKSQFQSKTK